MISTIILVNAIAAVGFPTAKIVLAHVQLFFFVGMRLLISGLFLFGYHYITTGTRIRYRKSDLLMLLKLAFFGFFLCFVCSIGALKYATATKASFLYNLTPFINALFSYFYFAEKMTTKKWVGLGIGFFGFIPMLLANGHAQSDGLIVSWADLLLIIAVSTYAYGMILTRKLMLSGHYSSTVINGTAITAAGIFSLLASCFFDARPLVNHFSSFDFLMFSLACLSLITGYTIAGFLLKHYTATFLSFAAFTMPFFAALYSWLLLGEHITWHFLASTVAVIIGLYIFYTEELKQGYITKH